SRDRRVTPTSSWVRPATAARRTPPVGDESLREEPTVTEPRTVVITGAARGLGLASAARLYREGWRVVAAMRTPDKGMPLLREATGASEDDDRLIGVQL